jgi:hypothetical protein
MNTFKLNWGASDNPFGPQSKPKDERRSFNRTQQNEIWDRQEGHCKMCKEKLARSATHFVIVRK